MDVNWLEKRSYLTGERLALVDAAEGKRYTFFTLNERVKSLAFFLLQEGVKKGDRVAYLAPNHSSYFELFFACAKIGAIFVPLNWRLSHLELAYILSDSTPNMLFFHTQFQEVVPAVFQGKTMDVTTFEYEQLFHEKKVSFEEISVELHDPYVLMYTGGTTGKPKGVVLTHSSILGNALNTIVSWGIVADDITPIFLPLFHTGGLNALTIPVLHAGGCAIIHQSFEPVSAITCIEEEKCTVALLVPTMYHSLIQCEEFSKNRVKSMKYFISGGAPCPLSIYEYFQEKEIPFKEGYGLTEAGPNNFYMDTRHAFFKKGSVGKPMMHNEIKLIDEDGLAVEKGQVGEIWIKGPHLFESYWKNEEATKEVLENGWFKTGDLGKQDEEGFYYIVGRKKDMIITGGENVYPIEIETVLDEHPSVSEIAVVGVPHKKWGEMVVAYVVVKEKFLLSEEEVKTYCQQRLGKYKVPKQVYFLNELPKTPVGKIDKKELVNEFQTNDSPY